MSKNTDLGNLVNGLFVDSSRRVGIGTSSPDYALTISGNTDPSSGIRIKNTDGVSSAPRLVIEQNNGQKMQMYAYGNSFAFNYTVTGGIDFYDGTNSKSRLYISSAGNVGIGTTSPFSTNGVNLEIVSTTSFPSRLILTNTSASGHQYFFQNQADGNLIIYDTTASAERMRIASSGAATFSSTITASTAIVLNPAESSYYATNGALSYYGTTNGVYLNGAGSNGWLRLQAAGTENNRNAINIFGGGVGNYITFMTSDSERMRISSTGDVLVGASAFTALGRFNSYSNGAAPAGRFVGGSGMADGNIALMVDKFSGTTSTSQWFLGFTISNQAAASGVITANGASQAAFGSWSDRRLKENIIDLPSQLSNILALRPVEFDYIESEGGGHQISFIAQEFAEIFPDAVGERQDGMKTLTGWGKTEAILVKSIQELSAQVQELKAEIDILKNK